MNFVFKNVLKNLSNSIKTKKKKINFQLTYKKEINNTNGKYECCQGTIFLKEGKSLIR